MTKKVKTIIISLIVISILMSGSQGFGVNKAYAATTVTSTYLAKVKKAYYNTIQKLVGVDSFALKDLNGDDIPELIVDDYNIYTYIDGKVRVMKEYDAGEYIVAYYSYRNTLQIQYEHMGLGCVNYYECEAESLQLTATYYYYNGSPDFYDMDVPSYELNGKKVTEKKFVDYYNKLGKGQAIKFYEASKSNLAKYLYKAKTYTYKDLGISTNEASHKLIYITSVSSKGFKYKSAKIVGDDIKESGKTYSIDFEKKLKLYIINKELINYKTATFSKTNVKKGTYWIPLYDGETMVGLAEQYLP